MSLPKEYEKVEILLNEKWVPATFYPADWLFADGMDEELWWMDYFMLDDGSTVPEDTQSGNELPEWRSLTVTLT